MKILLVDDEQPLLKALGRSLTALGHTVCTANGAVKALREMEAETPDVVISDIKMPEMNGLDLLERIRVQFVGTPVILMTGYGTETTAISALQNGAYDYIRKPVRLEKLLDILDQIDSRRHLEAKWVLEYEGYAPGGYAGALEKLIERIPTEADGTTLQVAAKCRRTERLWQQVEPVLQKLCTEKEIKNLNAFLKESTDLMAWLLSESEALAKIANQIRTTLSAQTNPLLPAHTTQPAASLSTSTD